MFAMGLVKQAICCALLGMASRPHIGTTEALQGLQAKQSSMMQPLSNLGDALFYDLPSFFCCHPLFMSFT